MTNRGLLIFLLPFLMACSHNRLDIDVSGVNIDEVKIDRLEEDLFTANPVTIELHQRLEKKYGTIYNSFLTIINGTWISDSASVKGLNLFTRDSAMREAYNDCKKIFPNTNWIVPQLSNVFKHFKHYFPKRNQPRVITYMSGFNYSLLAQDSTFGLGLEMYLGKENKFYTMLQFPKYKTIKMSKE
ncbi:MAG: hypothetical protein IT235_01200, partial [Bacteroidia bacterium]|nr:hypothetical protein [Bacteroidia bacterium]